MPIHFPSLKTLRLAMSSGAVPQKVAAAPAAAVFGEDGGVIVQAEGKLPAGTTKKLKPLGVGSRRGKLKDAQSFSCWQQLLPVEKVAGDVQVNEKTVVLFELHEAGQLPELVDEMLRLGNDRQAFRHYETDGRERTLLKVTGAPYYSLLRAIDGQSASNGQPNGAPIAYVEQSPRVWVELGYRHSSVGTIEPPPGQLLFIRPQRDWTFLNEAPLADIYSVLDFPLPHQPADAQPRELTEKLQVPLRLVEGGAGDAAELWVLHDNALEQVERFVRTADDRLLARLSFAVSGEEDPTVVLRARPSKHAPPVLVLDALACRPHLKLTNLFVPTGWRLHPPMRRDVVAKLLAPDMKQIVWLQPVRWPSKAVEEERTALEGHSKDGGFIPRSLADTAFRPLTDWVEYIVERDTQAMDAWMASYRFDFEPFVCKDDVEASPKPPQRKPQSRELPPEDRAPREQPPRPAQTEITEHVEIEEEQLTLPTAEEKTTVSQLQQELRQAEREFHASDEPLESAHRADQWRQMAVLNAALKRRLDATVCWANGLWESPAPPPKLLSSWLQCEKQTAEISGLKFSELDKLTAESAAAPSHANLVAALLVQTAHSPQPSEKIVARIDVLSRYIQRHEAYLPIRAAWLAWTAIVKLSNGDVLALARARDRLLERLYQHGMMAEFDLPSFLRAGGGVEAGRLNALRDYLSELQTLTRRWIVEPPAGPNAQTGTYAELMFAFALARLGEATAAETLLTRSVNKLTGKDIIHTWLADAFEFRVRQVLRGTGAAQRLNEDLLAQLEQMEKLDRYKVDRLRQQSRILEPYERIDPYRRWHGRYADDLSRELASLFDENDRDRLTQRIDALVKDGRKSGGQKLPRVLATALELSPRLGSDTGRAMLTHLPAALDASGDIVERALLLEKGLHIAAHFDETDTVRMCVAHFEDSLAEVVKTYLSLQIKYSPDNKEKLDTLDGLFTQSLRGLRKLGMRDEIGRLFGEIARLVHGSGRVGKAKKGSDEQTRRLGLLLAVIGGWYYFGQQKQANQVADEVRDVLLGGALPPIEQQNLACGYIRAVAQAPAEVSLPRIQELFELKQGEGRKLSGISDAMTTASHYSISQLNVIEAALLALVSDDFTMSDETRRWLDEDEYLVRRRIHRDVRQAMEAAGM